MNYHNRMIEKVKKLRETGDYTILAIETSCDETAASVTRGREVLSSVISSQIDIHKEYGGVVPEIASRNHAVNIDWVVEKALEESKLNLKDIDAVAVTYGAGLLGALIVGVSYAKALAFTLDVPLIAVNHIKGHIAANYIANKELEPPFLCLLTSGGHTSILKVSSFSDMEEIGATQDDAVGEAFDKVARVLGLPYPGGPEVEKLAREGKPVYTLPRPYKGEKHLNFSFSGLKTAVINLTSQKKMKGEEIDRAGLAASFQTAAVNFLADNAFEASSRTGIKTICLAGGVAANGFLRGEMSERGEREGVKVLLPPKSLCTDNAAMIGVAAFEEIKEGALPSSLDLDADPSL